MKLYDEVVVVTGTGNGIGGTTVRRFRSDGAKVVVTDIEPDAVERVAGDINSVGLASDITSEDSVRTVADLARRTYGEIPIWLQQRRLLRSPRAKADPGR